ncbi:serine/threonine-protein kinase [Nocardia sp. CDC153]|uniref:serine/threonine-protein kinase n=1 Tax=Nocardia sp. CDC153 TaxID=3112167 RepID=UPI002DB9B70D|nr:serine/threonine-protein kinase [Nocardia sp. CDC153]MEC3953765.1 serine/threonine-protein kinase [Nocardia sp. CDC153]
MSEPTQPSFAEYRIERRLGSTAMGTTALARHTRLDRLDDLTVLLPRYSGDDAFRDHFLATAELAARQRHPNLAVVRDAGVDNGLLWLASEHVDGVNVAEIIRLGGLDPARAVRIVAEVAKALDELHDNGLRHGDLNPADVIVAERPGEPDRVVLTGYGLPRPAPGPDEAAAPTYPTPEQTAGLPGERRSEVYALGCLLSEMLTGVRPDPARPMPPSSQNPWLPAKLDAVVARATAPRPEDRYPDCAALADAAIDAVGPASLAPRRPRSRRVRWLTVAAVVIITAAVGISAWAIPVRHTAAPATPKPTPVASTRSPELKAALWGAYAYVADAFPNLLPVSADGVGYQELYNCHAVDSKHNDVSLYDQAAQGQLWCWGNRNPVWSVFVTCNADRSPILPQPWTYRTEGEERWTRPTGTGYLRWGSYESNAGTQMAALDVYFDNPQESFCWWRVQAQGSASYLHTLWWPGVSV